MTLKECTTLARGLIRATVDFRADTIHYFLIEYLAIINIHNTHVIQTFGTNNTTKHLNINHAISVSCNETLSIA